MSLRARPDRRGVSSALRWLQRRARDLVAASDPQLLLWQISEGVCLCPEYRLLRVTAVLTARDDGSDALGTVVDGKAFPAAGALYDPAVHTAGGENYITDWIRLANLQLFQSGACFGLDVDNVTYVVEHSTMLHERECGDGKDQDTADFFANKAASPDSPYLNSVILLFRWGRDPSEASGQGCSSAASSYILMPGVYGDDGRYLDGVLRFGNNHLTHELGHFMGLSHPFPGVAHKVASLATADNPKRLAFTTANLPEMSGLTAADLQARLEEAREYIATWPYSLEQDASGNAKVGIPDAYGITDTPVDLSYGLPLVHGDAACTGTHTYTFQRYHHTDLQKKLDAKGELIWWEPKAGATPSVVSTVTVEESARRNIMGYWYCATVDERFSADQVKRMNFVLAALRSTLVARSHPIGPCWIVRLPILVKRLVPPWEPVVSIVVGLWQLAVRLFSPRHLPGMQALTRSLATRAVLERPSPIAGIARRKEIAELEVAGDPAWFCHDEPALEHHADERRSPGAGATP